MDISWPALILTSVTVGFLHTVAGPDHYLPFVALGSARGWSRRKLAVITVVCGGVHIATSMAIALVIGGLLGLGTSRVEEVFGWQGSAVAWALVALGSGYAAWSLLRPHRHRHMPDGSHLPDGLDERARARAVGRDVTVWTLVLIFAFGPCEAMIPLVMLPSAQGSLLGVVVVLAVFGAVTVATMTALVLLLHTGIRLVPTARLARAAHPLAGVVVALCGVAILFGL